MQDAGKPYSAFQLNDRLADGWCVIDGSGALVERERLYSRLSNAEAEATAERWNAEGGVAFDDQGENGAHLGIRQDDDSQ